MKEQPKITQLPLKMRIENAIMACGWPLDVISYIQFSINSYRASSWQFKRMHGESTGSWFKRSAATFRYIRPKQFEIFNYMRGTCCAEILYLVQSQSTPTSPGWGLQWEIYGGGRGIGLRMKFIVPGPQAWKADVLLRQMENDAWEVQSKPVINEAGVSSREYARAHPSPWVWRGGVAKSWSLSDSVVRIAGQVLGLDAMTRKNIKMKINNRQKQSKLL